jgi:copper(I)-binding protein
VLSTFCADTARAENQNSIEVSNIRARPTAPGAVTGVVYMAVANHGAADDDLTGLSTPVAEKAEMHRTVNQAGVMRMDAIPDLPIKAHGEATFSPEGLHVMLSGLKQPLKLGDTFPLTLDFAKAGPITVSVSVAPIKPEAKRGTEMPHMKM